MRKVTVTARLREGDEITSDEQEVADKDWYQFKNQLTHAMSNETGYILLTIDKSILIVGRQDVVLLMITEL